MNIAYRYIGGEYNKNHNAPMDEFLDVLFAVNAGMDTVRKIALKTKRGVAVTSQLVMLLTRQGYLTRAKVQKQQTHDSLKVTQRAHVLMQKAIEVEIELGLMRENRWGIEILM